MFFIFTARKQSLRRLCFYMCPSVHGGGGQHGIAACLAGGIPACLAGLWGGVSQHALQVSRPTPKGELEGSGQGRVSRPTPGGVSKHALRQTPPAHLTAIAAGGKHPTGMHSCNKYCCRCNYVE